MPIRQPVPTTIRVTDFRHNANSFPVESWLGPEEVPGKLVVSASAGYLLITPPMNQPNWELTFAYSRLADGSWLASGIVTVLLNSTAPIDGTIVIRSSLAETVVLTLLASASELLQLPTLAVSESALTFRPTAPNRPVSLIVTVAQHHSDAPITLTTDAPGHFQLATDSRPNFAPTLTFVPSPGGTYVHVRYLPHKTGVHKGELLIRTEYDQKTVTLTGQTTALLPTVWAIQPSNRQPESTRPGTLPMVLKQVTWLLALALLVSLSYVGYDNRCQFFPALCPETAIGRAVIQTNERLPDPDVIRTLSTRKWSIKPERTRKSLAKTTNPKNQLIAKRLSDKALITNVADDKEQVSKFQPVVPALPTRKRNDPGLDASVDARSRPRATPDTPTQESDLERELNQRPSVAN